MSQRPLRLSIWLGHTLRSVFARQRGLILASRCPDGQHNSAKMASNTAPTSCVFTAAPDSSTATALATWPQSELIASWEKHTLLTLEPCTVQTPVCRHSAVLGGNSCHRPRTDVFGIVAPRPEPLCQAGMPHTRSASLFTGCLPKECSLVLGSVPCKRKNAPCQRVTPPPQGLCTRLHCTKATTCSA